MSGEVFFGSDGIPWNPDNYKPLVINLALTGTQPKKADNPHVPISPYEIAENVAECFTLGARVFHLHMRDSMGSPSQDKNLFEQTIAIIRKDTPEAILCVTTSARASKNHEDRFSALSLPPELRPDFASLTLGSFNFPGSVSLNSPDVIRELLERMRDASIKPELEVFEPGMVLMERRLRKEGLLSGKPVFNILLGSMGSSPATFCGINSFLTLLPEACHWSLAGVGRYQLPVMHWAIAGGGHLRIGLEDAPFGPGRSKWTNAELVSRATSIAESLNRPIASPHEARTALGLI